MRVARYGIAFLAFVSSANLALAVDGVKLIRQPKTFPITIDAPGTYRLKTNIVVPDADTTAILINADDVTLDLNGFSLLGPTECTGGPPVTGCTPNGTGTGISSSNEGITVLNGTVRGMGFFGISLGVRARVENVHAVSNGCGGIEITDNGSVNSCNASSNGRNGIVSHFGNMISGNTVIGTGLFPPNCPYGGFNGTGIEGWAGSILTGNISRQNGDSGLVCGNGGGDCTMTNNVALNNANYGLVGCCFVGPKFYYANNVLNGNNGMLAGLQVSSHGFQMGTNICGGDTICP